MSRKSPRASLTSKRRAAKRKATKPVPSPVKTHPMDATILTDTSADAQPAKS
jgi:hypothetical protein